MSDSETRNGILQLNWYYQHQGHGFDTKGKRHTGYNLYLTSTCKSHQLQASAKSIHSNVIAMTTTTTTTTTQKQLQQ